MKPYIVTIGIDRKLSKVLRGLRFFILRVHNSFLYRFVIFMLQLGNILGTGLDKNA